MSYITKVVNTTSTECEFITEFVNQLTATDSRIICNTDIAEQFSDDEGIPTFDILITGIGMMRFVRNANLKQNTGYYKVDFIINNNKYLDNISLSLVPTSNTHSAIVSRTWSFSVHANSNFLILKLFSQNRNDFTKHDMQCIAITETNFHAVSAVKQNVVASTSNFIRTDSTENGRQYLFATRIPYTCNGNMEIIKSKVLTTNNTLPHTFADFYDCSTVAKDSIVTIDGNNYYALDENTLAPIMGGD